MCAKSRVASPGAGGTSLCSEGRISLYCFLITAALVLIPSVPQNLFGVVPQVWGAVLWGPFLYYALINMIIRFVLRNHDYQVSQSMRRDKPYQCYGANYSCTTGGH